MFSQILAEFLFRLTFGVAAAMAVTPSRWVTSGFFRVHLWVLLGAQTLAALVLYSANPLSLSSPAYVYPQFLIAVAAAAASYVGAVIWMYEARWLGKAAILVVACCGLLGSMQLPLLRADTPIAMELIDRLTSGLILGLVTTSMLLGHWYLNTPTMRLEPLNRLVLLLAIATVLRMGVCLGGTLLAVTFPLNPIGMPVGSWVIFLSLRWLTGLVGVLLLAWMTWQTLKIPNTQSATGILYAALILAFIGELTSQLLTAQVRYPV